MPTLTLTQIFRPGPPASALNKIFSLLHLLYPTPFFFFFFNTSFLVPFQLQLQVLSALTLSLKQTIWWALDVVPVPTPGSSCCQVLLADYTSLGQSLSSPEPAVAVVSFLLSNITSNLTLHLEVMLNLGPGPSAIASTKILQASYPCGPTFSLSAALKLPFIWSSRLSLAPSISPNLPLTTPAVW